MNKTICIGFSVLCLSIASYIIFIQFFIEQQKFDKALFHYDSPGIQKEVMAKLDELKIPYRIDKQGYILYQSVNEKRIKEISEEIKREFSPESYSISITNNEHKEYFLGLLKQANIPHKTIKYSGKSSYCIRWDYKYNDEVKQLKIKFFKAIGGSRPPKLAFDSESEKDILLTLLNEKNIPFKIIKSESVKSIGKISEVIEYEWSYYDEVEVLRHKARNMIREHLRHKAMETGDRPRF